MQQIFIGGVWTGAEGNSFREILNPATLKPLGNVADCGIEDIDRAVTAAREALPQWSGAAPERRAAHLREVGSCIRAQRRELAMLLVREVGKPLCEAHDCIDAAASIFERATNSVATRGRSACIIAALVPSNFPLLMMAAALAPAIATGDTVVCKPASQGSLASLMLTRAFEALPPGVVNIVTGGAETESMLARHGGIAERLELRWPSPAAFIVCQDADLDLAVPAIAWARLMNGGQGYGFGQHIYVESAIAQEFVDRMHPCVGFLDVDDPSKPTTDLGPLISVEAAHRVEDLVGSSLRAGAKLILGGRRFRPSGLPGHFFQPTILASVPPGSVPTAEAIPGPVITITSAASLKEAVGFAGSALSRGASIFTADPARVVDALDPTTVGVVRINDPAGEDCWGPFAGLRHSALQRAFGIAPSLATAPAPVAKPWWFPYLGRKSGY